MRLLSLEQINRYGDKGSFSKPKWPIALKDLLKKPLLRHLPHRTAKSMEQVGWLASEQKLIIRPNDDGPHEILHEFCHYLLCSQRRLSCNEFGLGRGFRFNSLRARPVISKAQAQKEETCVCLLTYSIEKSWRIPTTVIGSEILEESFCGMTEKEFNNIVAHILACRDRIQQRCGLRIYPPK